MICLREAGKVAPGQSLAIPATSMRYIYRISACCIIASERWISTARCWISLFRTGGMEVQPSSSSTASWPASGKPRLLAIDGLKSHGVARGELLPRVRHRVGRCLNNRAGNSHRSARRRERQMQRFTLPLACASSAIRQFLLSRKRMRNCSIFARWAVFPDSRTQPLAVVPLCAATGPAGGTPLPSGHPRGHDWRAKRDPL